MKSDQPIVQQPDKGSQGDGGQNLTPDSPGSEEYEFNLGMWRIETLNDILVACAQKYKKAIQKRDEKTIQEYQSLVNTLYTEAYIYMKQETEIEEEGVRQTRDDILENILDERKSYDSDQEALEHLREIRNIYLSVRTLMKEVGLDIPKSEKMSELDVFNQT